MEHRLAIIEDNTSIRESVRLFAEAKTAIPVIGEYGNVEDFLETTFTTNVPTILFLDIGLPGMSGLEGISHIKKKLPEINIIMLTTYEEEDKIFKALCDGACSYISKKTPLPKIIEALNIVAYGGSYMSPSIARKIATFFNKEKDTKEVIHLSPRQKEIVEHVVEGKTYNEIASTCFISLNTVRSHIKNIYEVLQVNNKVGLLSMYHQGKL